MNRCKAFGLTLGASVLIGCAADPPRGPVGTWHYDRQSLRELAHASALESVTDSGNSPISEDEHAELRGYVDRDHDSWDKRLLVREDGTFLATSRIGEAQIEEHTGTWTLAGERIHLVEEDGESMAMGRREGDRLVLEMTDDKGVTAQMVMLGVAKADR